MVFQVVFNPGRTSSCPRCLALPKNPATAIPRDPPTVEQITAKKPLIHMLKLMDVSDNSAEGVGQVFELLMGQLGLTVEEFFGRIQPMDGDLGTVQNFNCLRSQRAPSAYPQDQLNNIIFQLGVSHTLWNIASAIFSHHFGNASDSKDCGAWQYLQALGFPAEKAIQKKDFTLMCYYEDDAETAGRRKACDSNQRME
ncbi:hypothetical protein PCASD_16739 [Puccinia coronata f. sp. avenae]|uniref:DUF6589 domain-containing protein n=1 Tax=Puccinia coronata f. sp. avenae TaxID=200324 RepID=A0A2N5TVX2_9BASI|nr:hypothetical protein PCASD_24856 [Puccinia coronata f. sp. avenae]PLW29646.1 hypothetical protein PCASD_16739 [Puccinia coronata f. sp. avenae]